MTKPKVVLAYSGGLDTSVAIPWLQDHYGMDVIAFTVDLGQGKEVEEVREKALRGGAEEPEIELPAGCVVHELDGLERLLAARVHPHPRPASGLAATHC